MIDYFDIIKAQAFAEDRHAGQKYGDTPYTRHLTEVFAHAFVFVERYGVSPDVATAAWLHDTLEDTETSLRELVAEFGKNVASLVLCVTDEPGKNRRARAEKTLPKISVGGRDAIALKLADRLANVEACIDGIGNIDLIKMYRKEYPAFKAALYEAGEFDPVWKRLDLYLGDKDEDKRG